MVVSIEISGMLESKLRKLVELGIYASVSEAVRDAVRKMLANMDLMKIAMNIYLTRGSSLHYACEFAEVTCNKFIDYLLLNGVMPGLGWLGSLPAIDVERSFILDLSSLYVIFNSLLVKIFNIVTSKMKINMFLPEIILNEYRLNAAIAFKRGIMKIPEFKLIRVPEKSSDYKLHLTKKEYNIINFAIKHNYVLVSDDFYIQNISKKENLIVVPTISFLLFSLETNLINNIEYKETLFSLKGLPYIYPLELEER